jgi:hypothetical protein
MKFMKTKLYLSGPMTGIVDKNYDSFRQAVLALRSLGYIVVNPWELDVTDVRDTWAECLRRDIRALMDCDGVATLPGWKKSKGACLEVHIAKSLGWPVHNVAYWRDLCRIFPQPVVIG